MEFQANRLEAVLAAHRIPAQVHGGCASSRWLRFLVQAGPGTRVSRVRHLISEPAYDADSALRLLGHLIAEMLRRDEAGRSEPRIVIMVDELPDLLHQAGAPAQSALGRLARRGREAGLHLLLGAQKPTAALLGGDLKANVPVRLVGRVGSADDARVAAGISQSGAERLLGRGDFVAVTGGQAIRFQAAYVPIGDWVEFDRAIRAGRRWSEYVCRGDGNRHAAEAPNGGSSP